ncbi:MAG TPA: amino acid adenylation domain-containing protein, partial [Longimicrobiaceae bacterium]|nr:amino acid adenylation domain-containing protein [Longimicrobiaceae bacterium]
ERRQALAWGRGEPVPAAASTLHGLFAAQARARPHATALVHGERELTYAELERDANRIAHRLRRLGVGPEARVGVCMQRTPALVAALLGVLKAGGAYVPLDPAYPAPRLEHMLRAAGARVVLADGASRARLEAVGPGPALVAADAPDLAAEPGDDPGVAIHPGNVAYVIFTSGSTGGPKGVEIEHRGPVALLHWLRGALPDEERSAVLGSSSISFDLSIVEIFGTLCGGGTLVLVENALAPIPRPVRAAGLVPTVAAELLRRGGLPAGTQNVVIGGEVVTPALAAALRAGGAERILNIYGPTEDTTCSTWAELESDAASIPIGRPVAGGRVYVLDARLEPVGVGVAGELCVAGEGVARGYAGRPGLTAASFVPDPFGPPGSRMYRTGDIGRWRADGALEFLGRRDGQVKVRGVRVELGEVEAALAAHPAVREAAAALREDGLVAWLVAAEGAARPQAAELRAFLRASLPEAMVPGVFAWTGALPRTGSGKLDRRALPDPEPAPAGLAVRKIGPRSGLEETLAALWREVLGVEQVGIHDDFFELGGHSLLALRLMARLREELGRDLPVATLFRAPSVESMARAFAGGLPEILLPLVPLQPLGSRRPLFLAPPGGGHLVCYRTLSRLLAPELPVYGLQARGLEDGRDPLRSIEEMGAYFVEAVRALQPGGPYFLGGWSLGGVLSFEMARQLEGAGDEVALLALLDTGVPESETETKATLDHARVLVRILGDVLGFGAAALVRPREIRHLPPREQLKAALRQMSLREPLPPSRYDEVLELTRVRRANLHALLDYRPGRYAGHVTYVRTAGSERKGVTERTEAYWAARADGGLSVTRISGNHGTLLHEPHVRALVAELLARTG